MTAVGIEVVEVTAEKNMGFEVEGWDFCRPGRISRIGSLARTRTLQSSSFPFRDVNPKENAP